MNKSVFIGAVIILLLLNCQMGCAKKASMDADFEQPADSLQLARSAMAAKAEDMQQPSEPSVVSPVQTGRLMIYSGVIYLVVDNISDTLDRVKISAEKAGGYMQSMSANSIVVKVPAEKFQGVIIEIEKFGEVSNKEIKGSDVTEEMQDLKIRLNNAEELRKRLVSLLNRADKVEDAIKIEKELGRVTETIELIKGKIRSLDNQIAYSTLTVYANSPLPQLVIKEEIPFFWVRGLGEDLSKSTIAEFGRISLWSGVDFELPKSFAKYYEFNHVTRATSADGVLIKVQRNENVEGGDLEFWTNLAKRSLIKQRALSITKINDIKIHHDVDAKSIEGVKEISGKKYGYMVGLARTKNYVYAYEAWGEFEKLNTAKSLIEESIRSMDILYFIPF